MSAFGDSMNDVLRGVQYVQQNVEEGQARRKKNALAGLAGQYYGGQVAPENQQRFLQDYATQGGDPEAFKKDAILRAGQHAALLLEAPDPVKPQMYSQLIREMRAAGVPVPQQADNYDPSYLPMIGKFAQTALGAAGNAGGNVQSTYIDAQGNRVAIMRDGSTQILGQNAPNNQIIAAEGGYYGVNKGSLQAAPVQIGGAPPQSPGPPPGDASNKAMVLANMLRESGLPVEEIDAILGRLPGMAPATAESPQPEPGQQWIAPPAGGQLQPAPKPVNPAEAERLRIEQERLRLSQNADDRAATAAATPKISTQERKDMLARRAKIPQLQNTVRGMTRIKEALGKLGGALIDTGPADAKIQKYTQAGQELEAAVGAIQNSMLSLTRVPGIGSQSDLEARIAGLQYPSLDKAPEVNARTIAQLEAFVTDLAQAYQVAAESDQAVATGAPTAQTPAQQDAAPKRLKFNPATGKLE